MPKLFQQNNWSSEIDAVGHRSLVLLSLGLVVAASHSIQVAISPVAERGSD